jgi:hypothetical protein
VLCEVANELAERVRQNAYERAAIQAALTAISAHAAAATDGQLRSAVAAARRGGGDLVGNIREVEIVNAIAARNLAAWSTLPGLLASDPAASVSLSTDDPAAPPKESAA